MAHGLVSSALFVLCNISYSIFKTRSLFLIKGTLSFRPLLTFMWFFALAANMGAPPAINLQGEIMLVVGVLQVCGGGLLPFVVTSLFLRAAYCLHVFIATQHGSLSYSFSSPIRVSVRSILCVFLHLMPVFLLILKREVICGWC